MPVVGLAVTTDPQGAAELEYIGTSIWTPEEVAAAAAGLNEMPGTTSKRARIRAEHALVMRLDHPFGSASL